MVSPKKLIVNIGALVPVALCCCVCTARASSSTDDLVPQRARSTALYEETLGAEAPAWEKMPEAFRLWTELAKAGDAEAKYYLSGVYFRGIPDLVAADSNVALALIEEAADSGFAEAQFALAWQLESGANTKANPSEALRRYEQAANNGFALAMSRLIRIYSSGELGQPVNEQKADVWRDRRRRCCSNGH
jgi:TPR repeat protein